MRSLKIVCAAALVMLEAGCGLPNPYFLTAPGTGNFPAGYVTTCTFTSPGYASGSNFVGFEVYYKIISSAPPSSNDINLGGGGVTGPFVLQANGFFPVALSTDTPGAPSLPVIQPASTDIPNPLTVTLDLFNSLYFYTVGSTSTPNIAIGRNLANNQAPFTGTRSFMPGVLPQPNYTSSDTDMGSGVYSACAQNSRAYIILYALSFGIQNGSVQEWSIPVYLGYVGITPFP